MLVYVRETFRWKIPAKPSESDQIELHVDLNLTWPDPRVGGSNLAHLN